MMERLRKDSNRLSHMRKADRGAAFCIAAFADEHGGKNIEVRLMLSAPRVSPKIVSSTAGCISPITFLKF